METMRTHSGPRTRLWTALLLCLAACSTAPAASDPTLETGSPPTETDTGDATADTGTSFDTETTTDTAATDTSEAPADESCDGPWVHEIGEAVKVPDIPGTPALVEGHNVPVLRFEKDESRAFCARMAFAPSRVVVKIDFKAAELHNHIGCAGLLLTATPRTGPYAGETLYSQDPDSPSFARHSWVRARGDRIEEGIWDLVLTDKSVLADHNDDGVVTTEQMSQGGDQCTIFSLKALTFYE